MTDFTRRDVLTGSSVLLAAVAGVAAAPATAPAASRLKVLVTGAQPDDPESGCGGVIARYADAGHDVAILYLTRGVAGQISAQQRNDRHFSRNAQRARVF